MSVVFQSAPVYGFDVMNEPVAGQHFFKSLVCVVMALLAMDDGTTMMILRATMMLMLMMVVMMMPVMTFCRLQISPQITFPASHGGSNDAKKIAHKVKNTKYKEIQKKYKKSYFLRLIVGSNDAK